MKKLMLLSGVMTVMMSCEKPAEDMSAKDLPAGLNSKQEEPHVPTSGKDSLNPRAQTKYYFAAYQVSKTEGSEKLGMDVASKVPDNPSSLYISGYSFVNMYGGSYTYNEADGAIKNNELITTEMAGSDAANTAEAEFYKNLQDATKIVFEENQVKLYIGKPTKEVMIFKKR